MASKVKPIKPEDIAVAKKAYIPYEVVKAFNNLIAKEWNGREAIVKQCDVIKEILKMFDGTKTPMSVDGIYKEEYLEVEEIYRAEGWHVEYDKPGYDDHYEPNWTFRKNKSR